MATYMVFETVLAVAAVGVTTVNIALWAFRPGSYRPGPRARRWMGIITVAWVILLPVGGAISLGLGADALAAGQGGAWPGIVTGSVALACWPVVILALRKRRATSRTR
jgi:hypothetical protein